MPYVELLFGLYVVACIAGTLIRYRQITISIPFLLLFGAGYFYVSFANFYGPRVSDSVRKAKAKVKSPSPIHLPALAEDSPQARRETA